MIYFFIEETRKTEQALEKLTNDLGIYQEVFQISVQKIYDKYSLPALHVEGDGFNQGDATDEEMEGLWESIRSNSEEYDVLMFLDRKLLKAIKKQAKKAKKEWLKKNWIEHYKENIRDFLKEKYPNSGGVLGLDWSVYINIYTGEIFDVTQASANWSFPEKAKGRRKVCHINNYEVTFQDWTYEIDSFLYKDYPEEWEVFSEEEKVKWIEENRMEEAETYNETERKESIEWIIDNLVDERV